MNNEIKEILDNMKEISSFEYTTDWFELNYKDTKILLDYITNLQKENERLKEWKEDLLKENIELENTRKEVIKYMQENYNELTDYGYKKEIYDDLSNILQNESESNE